MRLGGGRHCPEGGPRGTHVSKFPIHRIYDNPNRFPMGARSECLARVSRTRQLFLDASIPALWTSAQRGSGCRTVLSSTPVSVTLRCSGASLTLSFLVDPNPIVLPSGLPFTFSRFRKGGALPPPHEERRLSKVQQELHQRVFRHGACRCWRLPHPPHQLWHRRGKCVPVGHAQ